MSDYPGLSGVALQRVRSAAKSGALGHGVSVLQCVMRMSKGVSEPDPPDITVSTAEVLFDAVDLPIVVVGPRANIEHTNAAWRACMQGEAGDIYAPSDPRLCECVRAVCAGTAERAEYEADGEVFGGTAYKVLAAHIGGTEPRRCTITHVPVTAPSAQLTALQTELALARRQLLQAQRLESVGRLSGGVAHDFNNMLTSIICFTRFVVDEMVAEDPRRADLIEVLKSADHAARLTNQLLAFSRRKPLQPVPINVNDAVTSVGRVLRRTLGEHIELVIEPSDEALWVTCDPGQFDQLLFNLAVLAKDALPRGGVIRITLGRSHVIGSTGLPAGEYVELSFVHRHMQIAPGTENEAAVSADTSSGLGLATCRVIAEQAQGALLPYADAEDAGYRVLLPKGEERASAARRLSFAPVSLRGTVLVVEDQPAILRTMVRALSATGLTVFEASSAEDALAVLDSRPQVQPELLVTDVVLPRMSGPHLVEQLRTRFSELRVLFVSGYIGEEVAASGMRSGDGTAFVMKPFTGRQLAVRAAALLGQRGGTLTRAGS